MTNTNPLQIPSHVEVDVRRPDGTIETVRPANPVNGGVLRTITERQIAELKAATLAAGRGEVLDVRNVTREVPAAQPTEADLAEEDYIRHTNAVYAASAGGERHDRIGGVSDADRTPAHPSDSE